MQLAPADAIERLVALQAQEPASPYIALLARLEGFSAGALHAAFVERRVVKSTLMRVTLHVVSARDYVRFWPGLAPMLRRWREASLRRFGIEIPLEEIGRTAMEYASRPRTAAELRSFLPELPPPGPAGQLDGWWAVRVHLPFVITPGEAPWTFGRGQRFVTAQAWLDEPLVPEDEGLRHLVRRYLAAFGPATLGDMAQFSGILRSHLKEALGELGDELSNYRTEAGRLLYDLTDSPLTAADAPSPPRLLPMWDSLLLAYEDRGRVIPAQYRRRVIQVNGDILPTVLLDGHVAGVWWAEATDAGSQVRWHLFEPVARGVERRLAEEADRVAAFVEPIEPAVYRRYVSRWIPEQA